MTDSESFDDHDLDVDESRAHEEMNQPRHSKTNKKREVASTKVAKVQMKRHKDGTTSVARDKDGHYLSAKLVDKNMEQRVLDYGDNGFFSLIEKKNNKIDLAEEAEQLKEEIF